MENVPVFPQQPVAVVNRGAIYKVPKSCKDFLYPGCLIGSDFRLGVPLMVILTIKERPCVEGVSEEKKKNQEYYPVLPSSRASLKIPCAEAHWSSRKIRDVFHLNGKRP